MFKSVILLNPFLSFLVLFLTSCEGFFSDNNLEDKIKAAIDYANASTYKILIKADIQQGDFLSSGEKDCKLDYTIDVQFTVNSQDYIYKGLEAVNKNDPSISLNDYVEFTQTSSEQDIKNGIYKTTIKLLKASNDILIRPVCVLIPKVIDIYPPFSSMGYDQDSTIKITFNKSMKTETFGDFSCISILDSDADLKTYYQTPYFSKNNTVLSIPTVKGKYIIEQNSNESYRDISLTLDFSQIKDEDNLDFGNIQNYTFRLNKHVDNVKPLISEYHIFSTKDKGELFYKELTNKPMSEWSSTIEKNDDGSTKYQNGHYSQNHVSKLYFTVSGYDNESGIKCLRIKETANAGDELTETTYQNDYDTFIIEEENGIKKCIFEVEYDFKTREDGLLVIDLCLVDIVGNESTYKTCYVIKDSYSVCEASSKDFKLYFLKFMATASDLQPLFPAYNSETREKECTLSHWDKFDLKRDNFYSSYNSQQFLTIKLLNNDKIITAFENYDIGTDYQLAALVNKKLALYKLNPDYTIKFQLILEDESGVKGFVEYEFPEIINVSAVRKAKHLSWDAYAIIINNYNPKYEAKYRYIYAYEKEDGTLSEFSSLPFKNSTFDYCETTAFEADKTYYIYAYKDTNDLHQLFRGFLGAPYIFNKSNGLENVNLPELEIDLDSVDYEKNTGMATINVSLNFDENLDYGNYDYSVIAVEKNNEYYSSSYLSTNSNQLRIKNKQEYILFVVAKDKTTGIVIAETPNDDKQEVFLNSVDNFAPSVKSGTEVNFGKNSVALYVDSDGLRVTFNESNLADYKDNVYNNRVADIKSVEYWIVPSKLGDELDIESLNNSNFSNGNASIDYDIGYFEIPFYLIPQEEKFYIYFNVVDNSSLQNNVIAVSSEQIIYPVQDYIPEVDYSRSTTLGFKANYSNLPYSSDFISIKYQDEGKWKDAAVSGVDSETHDPITIPIIGKLMQRNGSEVTYDLEYNDFLFNDKFIRVSISCHNSSNSTTNRCYYLKNLYVYPEYYQKKGTSQEIKCNSKTWMKVQNGYHVFCDAPCFVHTMYSQNLLSLTNTESDASMWETAGRETGIIVSDGNQFTYTDDNLASVPANYYYTTIIHFADGTMLMTDVKQK